MKTIFGIKGFDILEYAIAANAILGIRDSGKTYSATEASEELFEASIPFVWLDPIGVAHNLRVPGKGRGYPVVVAGGRFGDLPLTVKNAGEIVRSAMQANVSLVIDLFSHDLSKADWRRIVKDCVTILLHENSDYGLRHVFIEEAAEFVPQKVTDGDVFAAVEKLVRMGGNSKLGCTLINQRSADINKSVLELCANVFVHRQKGKNTLLDLKKWFELLDLTDAEQKNIADSLPNLKSGECWALLNDLPKPVFVKVPQKNSLHPDRRAKMTAEASNRKPVPADKFVAKMQAKLAEKIPKTVQATAGQKKNPAVSSPVIGKAELKAEYDRGYGEGFIAGRMKAWDALAPIQAMADKLSENFKEVGRKIMFQMPATKPVAAVKNGDPIAHVTGDKTRPAPPRSVNSSGLSKATMKALNAIAWWRNIGVEPVLRDRACIAAGLSTKASTFSVYVSQLMRDGYVEDVGARMVKLTASGVAIAEPPADQTNANLRRMATEAIRGGQPLKVFDMVYEAWPGALLREDIADRMGLSRTASTTSVYISKCVSLGILETKSGGIVIAPDWLFPESGR